MELTPEERQRIYAEEKARVEIQKQLQQESSTKSQLNTSVSKTPTSKLKLFGIALLVLLALVAWQISVPVVIIWYLFKKTPISKRTKWIATAFILVIYGVIVGQNIYTNRTPTLSITEPQNNLAIQSEKVTIKGRVEPASSKIKVGNDAVDSNEGNFSYDALLRNEKNTIIITAENGTGSASTSLVVNRIFTDEEITQIEKQKAEAEAKKIAEEKQQKKTELEVQAKAIAEQKEWENSKAGQLCRKHPDWSRSDCTNLANNKVWIGMTYEMLLAGYGKPNSINPSDYGSGTQTQYCYTGHNSPNCFYDKNDDGIIDAYN